MSGLTDTDTTALEAIRESFVAQFPEDASAEASEAVEAHAEAVEGGQAVDTAAPEGVPTSEAQAEVQPPEPAETEPESRGYRRLLARESKLREDQKALETARKEIEADRAAVAQWKAAQAQFKRNPVAALKGLGLDTKAILETLQEAQAEDLGDLAPPEVRLKLATKRAERLAAEAEETVRRELDADKAQRYVQEYQSGLTQFVTSGLTEFPELAKVAAAGKPVQQALWQTAVEMANANPNGPAPSYADVAKQLNSQLAELVSVVSPAPNPTAPVATATPPATAGKPVLRNNATQTQPGPAPEAKNLTYAEYREQLRQKVLAAHGIAPR
jgi:hypothetical protein